MLARIAAVALNAYREAVRARVLYGLLGVALATTAYSLVVATLSLHQEIRVVADLGAASISLYAVLVAIVLGATSLHNELERKTLFPILTRRLRRHEYLVGKYLGALATLGVFVAIDGGAVLAVLAIRGGERHRARRRRGGGAPRGARRASLQAARGAGLRLAAVVSVALLRDDGAALRPRSGRTPDGDRVGAPHAERGRDRRRRREPLRFVLVAIPHRDLHPRRLPRRALGRHDGQPPTEDLRPRDPPNLRRGRPGHAKPAGLRPGALAPAGSRPRVAGVAVRDGGGDSRALLRDVPPHARERTHLSGNKRILQ